MRFADVVNGFVGAGDVVWVQDYHLMLLPMLLRSLISGAGTQGAMVRRELGRVQEGVQDEVFDEIMGSSKQKKQEEDEGVDVDEGTKTPTSPAVGTHAGMTGFQAQEAAAKSVGKEGVKIGFFLHTPFPSSEIYR